jgi:translation initiation factor 6
LCSDVIKQVHDILDVQAITIGISDLIQTGSIAVTTNKGGVIHPGATETEIKTISDILNVNLEPGTINGGIPYLASGIIANSKSIVVGNLTTGPELIMLSRAFNL